MLAVIPVRDGALPTGADETVAECTGRTLLVGHGTPGAAAGLAGLAGRVLTGVAGAYSPGAWAGPLAGALRAEDVVVLPASADGRDLAPRLAHALGRPLLAGAVQVSAEGATLSRWGGLVLEDHVAGGPFVATLQPGVRGVELPPSDAPVPELEEMVLRLEPRHGAGADATVVEVLEPDVATMDLAEAPRIVAGGAGLDSAERMGRLDELARALGAALGATRVVTDRGWVGHERQIGTTGVVVDPRLYVAFGISGAVQHTSGLGRPDHVVSVNLDPHCPMMQLADLAVVADANEVIDALLAEVGVPASS
jgi:electron transfer flavoprotein alpha subunit